MFELVKRINKKSLKIPSYYYDAARFFVGRQLANFNEEKLEDGRYQVTWLIPDGVCEVSPHPQGEEHQKVIKAEIAHLHGRLRRLLDLIERLNRRDLRPAGDSWEGHHLRLCEITCEMFRLPEDPIKDSVFVTRKGHLVITDWVKREENNRNALVATEQVSRFCRKLRKIYRIPGLDAGSHDDEFFESDGLVCGQPEVKDGKAAGVREYINSFRRR